MPDLFCQMYHEMEIASSKTSDDPSRPSWRKPGETAADARDRLRAEREALARSAA